MIELLETQTIFYRNQEIIHIDIDPASISKRVKIDVPIVGNVKSVLKDMNEIYSTLEKNHDKDPVRFMKRLMNGKLKNRFYKKGRSN